MINFLNPPVSCDNCAGFALATLDDQYLCSGCLMSALLSTTDPLLFERVVALGNDKTGNGKTGNEKHSGQSL